MLAGKRILLVISGGIAAYKSLVLIRRLRERGAAVRVVLTRAGAHFVTPLSVAALAHEKVYQDQFSLVDEAEMGHLRLSQEADLVVVAPASADILARMAQGLADELATTVLLASAAPILAAPAMNHRMWNHPATRANVKTLAARGVRLVGPETGSLAEDETGIGRMSEPEAIVAAIEAFFAGGGDARPLAGRHAIVTSGPTFEAIDPVRFLGNRSSGKQGHAIAAALAAAGARVTLVSGPVGLPDPPGVTVVRIESAREMLAQCRAALPADVFVAAAAVADWRPAKPAPRKLKKSGAAPPALALAENPDILATVASLKGAAPRGAAPAGAARPRLVVGFAAETENVVANAVAKRAKKRCDWMLANDVAPGTGTFGGDANTIHFVTAAGVEAWPRLDKDAVARRLAERIAAELARP